MPLIRNPKALLLFSWIICCSPAVAAEPEPAGYKLQPGDVLQVTVWKETDLLAETLIRPDGGLSFPLAGDTRFTWR